MLERSTVISLICLLSGFIFSSSAYSQQPQYVVNIHGYQFSCVANNGQQVPIYFSPSVQGARADLNTQTGIYTIGMNLQHMNMMHPLAAIFTAFHECGHVALPLGIGLSSIDQESNADCFAIRNMRDMGMIMNGVQFENAISVISNTPATMTHPPGEIRRQRMLRCLSF